MSKILPFPNAKSLEQISLEDDDNGFTTVLNEHPEVKTLYERRNLYPEFLEINGVNPIVHVVMEGIVENQLHTDKGVREIHEKLQREKGLTPHAARASIAGIFIREFYAVMKEHKPFDNEAYMRRLALIGSDVRKLGRNDRCPCGSGAKFKRCCATYAESFRVFPLAGRLDLGHGYYIHTEPTEFEDPLEPIFQLEARCHIAEYMEAEADLEGALAVLEENITLAKAYCEGYYLENAWQEYMLFCQRHKQFNAQGLIAADNLISLADNNEAKGNSICDKANYLVELGNMEAAEAEYTKLFTNQPDFYFGRFRYALMLSNNGREEEAKQVLTGLLSTKGIDLDTREAAEELLSELDVDTND